MSQSLAGLKVVLGITGSIAAYKAADLVRRLREAGAQVRVIMTHGACAFITPLTLQSLSGHPVCIELLDADQEAAMGHITLARWADWIMVAPASADFIARFAQGRADDLLTATLLATRAPVAIAPAMNVQMWSNPSTQSNLALLRSRGVYQFGPAAGLQACGELGEGRLLEPMEILESLEACVVPKRLQGLRVVVTAGPTQEAIDPVRYLSNHSSGKMGFALAQAAAEAGATVTLIAGPVHQQTPVGCERRDVRSAEAMYAASMACMGQCDIFIACAAVADYTPLEPAAHKLKKQSDTLTLALKPTPDIVHAVSTHPLRPRWVVGFAAETQNLAEHAKAKLRKKQLDWVCANWVGEGQAFGQDHNAIEVFWPEGHLAVEPDTKIRLARSLMTLMSEHYHAKNSTEIA